MRPWGSVAPSSLTAVPAQQTRGRRADGTVEGAEEDRQGDVLTRGRRLFALMEWKSRGFAPTANSFCVERKLGKVLSHVPKTTLQNPMDHQVLDQGLNGVMRVVQGQTGIFLYQSEGGMSVLYVYNYWTFLFMRSYMRVIGFEGHWAQRDLFLKEDLAPDVYFFHIRCLPC